MSVWLDTSGNTTLGIGICDRCRRKFPLAELMPDRNSPGLKVCKDDLDDLDPYRLAPRAPDMINLLFVRPDENIALPFPASVVLRITENNFVRITEDDRARILE